MKRVVKWFLIFVVALAVGATILVYNPGLVKGSLERYLSDMAGYSISVEGKLEIRPGRLTEITATGIRVSGPDWAKHPDLVVIGFLNLTLQTSSLFKDIIVLDSLRVDEAQINLETNTESVGNWISANPPDTRTNNTERAPIVIFHNIKLNDIRLHFLSARKKTEQLLHLATFGQKRLPDGMLNISLLGNFNNEAVAFEGNVGPYDNLLRGQDISYTGSGNFGSLEISSSGLIDDLLDPRYPQFDLELQGPNIDKITTMFGADDLGSGIFSLTARGANVNGRYEADLNGSIGDISLNVSARASDVLELNELDLTLAANGPNLGAFMRTLGIENWPDKPFEIKGDIDRVGSTLDVSKLTLNIGDAELVLDALLGNFPSLGSSRVRLSVTGTDAAQFRELLGIRGIATGPFEIQGRLDVSPQVVELLQIEMKTAFGHLTVSGTLGPGPTYDGSRLHVKLDGNNAHTLMSLFNVDAMSENPFNLDARIETTGSGLFLERFLMETAGNERLELGGYLSYKPGSQETAVDVTLNGQHLRRVLHNFIPGVEVPDLPYDLSGHVLVGSENIQLRDVKAAFADVELDLAGSVSLRDRLAGTSLDFHLGGKTLSTLQEIPGLDDPLSIFVPGQAYHAAGRFYISGTGWRLDNVKGTIGVTDFVIDGQISNQAGWSGSNVDFSIKGPDFHAFLINQDASDLSIGAFESNGRLRLSGNTLSIEDFSFVTDKTSGEADLKFGWPIDSTIDADFNVELWGPDIRHLIPSSEFFEPAMATYRISAAGHQRDNLISFNHFDAVIGDLQVTLEGKADENIEITFSAQSGNFSTLGAVNGRPLPAMALNLKADFSGDARHFGFHNISGKLGETDISGKIEILLDGLKPKFSLTAKSEFLDLQPFLGQFDKGDKEAKTPRPERLIPATPLPLDVLRAADVSLSFSADEIRHRKDSLKNLVLELNVLDGKLHIPVMTVNGSREGQYKSSLTLEPTDARNADVFVDIEAENMLLNIIGRPSDKLSELPLYDLEFHGRGKGGDLRELAASLNGSLSMGSGGGSLGNVDLGMLDLFVLNEIFDLVMPKSNKDDVLEVNCYASSFKITDGLVRTDPAIVYSTNKLNFIAKGTLNLKTEKLDFNFNATPTKALKVSAGELFNPYIRISGTLASPKVGLDPGKALLHGGAAVGTAGISILAKGLLDRMSNVTPLCEEMLEQARQDQ